MEPNSPLLSFYNRMLRKRNRNLSGSEDNPSSPGNRFSDFSPERKQGGEELFFGASQNGGDVDKTEKIKVLCAYCNKSFPIDEFSDHDEKCEMRFVPCENCGERILIDVLDYHSSYCQPNNQQFHLGEINYGYGYEHDDSPYSEENKDFHEEDFQDIDENGIHYSPENFQIDSPQPETYEELLSLDENKVNSGMTKRQLEKFPLRTFFGTNNSDHATCNVCLSDFELGDRLRKLKCNHEFHMGCIDKWLSSNITCPVCKKFLR